jgi:uroporphyrinogen-III synthase
MTRVLVLRPEPGANATVERARARGLEAFAIRLFEVAPVAWDPPEASGFDGLLLTSANAVRHAGPALESLRGLPVYAVGAATADAARHAGFDIASTGDADLDRLLGSIEPDLKLLHLAGAHRTAATDARQQITCVTVYRADPVEDVDLSAAAGAVALVHSPRAGRRFAELLDRQRLDKSTIGIAAISRNAADAAGSGWAQIEVADAPTDEALLAVAERLCNKLAAT